MLPGTTLVKDGDTPHGLQQGALTTPPSASKTTLSLNDCPLRVPNSSDLSDVSSNDDQCVPSITQPHKTFSFDFPDPVDTTDTVGAWNSPLNDEDNATASSSLTLKKTELQLDLTFSQQPQLVIQSPKTPTLSRKLKAASLDSDTSQHDDYHASDALVGGDDSRLNIPRNVISMPCTPKRQMPKKINLRGCSGMSAFGCGSLGTTATNLQSVGSNASISSSQTLKTLPEVMTLNDFGNNLASTSSDCGSAAKVPRMEPVKFKAKGLLERRGSNVSLTIDLGAAENRSPSGAGIVSGGLRKARGHTRSTSNLYTPDDKCGCAQGVDRDTRIRNFSQNRTATDAGEHNALRRSHKFEKLSSVSCLCDSDNEEEAGAHNEAVDGRVKGVVSGKMPLVPCQYSRLGCLNYLSYMRRKSLSNENLYLGPSLDKKSSHNQLIMKSRSEFPRTSARSTKPNLSDDFQMHLQNIQYLQTAGNTLTINQLQDSCKVDNLKVLHKEFWELPQNFQEKSFVSGTQSKNRYKTILPNEHSRVILEPRLTDTTTPSTSITTPATITPAETYINANYIKGYDYTETAYIATQGPLSHTTGDLWQMVVQSNARKLVMLTPIVEKGRVKCELYFPRELHETVTCGNYEITCVDVVRENFYFIRKLRVRDKLHRCERNRKKSDGNDKNVKCDSECVINVTNVDDDKTRKNQQNALQQSSIDKLCLNMNRLTISSHKVKNLDDINNKKNKQRGCCDKSGTTKKICADCKRKAQCVGNLNLNNLSNLSNTMSNISSNPIANVLMRQNDNPPSPKLIKDKQNKETKNNSRSNSENNSPNILANKNQSQTRFSFNEADIVDSLDYAEDDDTFVCATDFKSPFSRTPGVTTATRVCNFKPRDFKFSDDFADIIENTDKNDNDKVTVLDKSDLDKKVGAVKIDASRSCDYFVEHFWYETWPDHNMANVDEILALALDVLNLKREIKSLFNDCGSEESDGQSSDEHGSSNCNVNINPNSSQILTNQRVSGCSSDCHSIVATLANNQPSSSAKNEHVQCKRIELIDCSNVNNMHNTNLNADDKLNDTPPNDKDVETDCTCTSSKNPNNPSHVKCLANLTLAQQVPIVVHCSAGIGRTGCFLAILNGIQQLKANANVDILAIVCILRLCRGGMVQTAEQYELIYRVLARYSEYLNAGDKRDKNNE